MHHPILSHQISDNQLCIVNEDVATSIDGECDFLPIDCCGHETIGHKIRGQGISQNMVGQHSRQRGRISEQGIHYKGRQRTHGCIRWSEHRPWPINREGTVKPSGQKQLLQDRVVSA